MKVVEDKQHRLGGCNVPQERGCGVEQAETSSFGV